MPNVRRHRIAPDHARRQPQTKSFALALLLLTMPVILALTSCDASWAPTAPHSVDGWCNGVPQSYTPEAVFTCAVTFAPAVTYAQALRMLTDVGIQPTLSCHQLYATDDSTTDDAAGLAPLWEPSAQRTFFAQWHTLVVLPTPLAVNVATARRWTDQLSYYLPGVAALRQAAPAVDSRGSPIFSTTPRLYAGVNFARYGAVGYTCPPLAPKAGASPTLLTTDDTTYARISFSDAFLHSVTYDTALYEIVNLGLRLADPCYETGIGTNFRVNPSASIDQQGQEGGYAKTHSLIVATTLASSTQWQSQARAIGGVTGLAVVGGSVCAQ